MTPVHVLVYGGIGSGKSTVSSMLGSRGMEILSADRLGHEVLEDEAFAEVTSRWPEVEVEGRIDRKRLAGVVFADGRELEALEALTHPHIRHRVAEALKVANGPLVVEVHVPDWMSEFPWFRVFVDASEDTRTERLVRRGMDAAEIRARMLHQPGRRDYLRAADFVIDNNGPLRCLISQVDQLAADLVSGSRGSRP